MMFENHDLYERKFVCNQSGKSYTNKCNKSDKKTVFQRCSITSAVFEKVMFLKKNMVEKQMFVVMRFLL